MSRHHRAHKRGWPGASGRGPFARRGGAVRAAVDRDGWKCITRPSCRQGGDARPSARRAVSRCHLSQHHQPDPARLAWARFLEEFPC